MRKVTLRVVAPASLVLTALLATSSSIQAAEPPPLSDADTVCVQGLVAHAVSAPTNFRAVKMHLTDALEAIAPGEQPLGDYAATLADHEVVVMFARGAGLAALTMSVPPNYKGDPSPTPIAILLVVDVNDCSQLGGTYVYQDQDLARFDLTVIRQRKPASAEVEVEVRPTR